MEYEASSCFECGKMRTRITPNTDAFYAVGHIAFETPGSHLICMRVKLI